MGNGQRVGFWKDKWCEDELLYVSFPSLFALALIVEGGGWVPCFSRSFNDWEVESVERFLLKLQAKMVYRDEEDMVI